MTVRANTDQSTAKLDLSDGPTLEFNSSGVHLQEGTALMRRHGKARRTIIIYVIALLVLGGLILAAAMRAPVELIPPEGPEMLALRQATDNAYYPLLEIGALLPTRPEPLKVLDPEFPQWKVDYKPEEGSIAGRLGVGRPDSDPLLRAYVFEDAEPALAKLREAFACSHYHYPELGNRNTDREHLHAPQGLAHILVGRIRFIVEENGSAEEAFGYLWDVLRLGQIVGSDGICEDFFSSWGIQISALSELPALARYAQSPETLVRAAERLKAFQASQPGLRKIFEGELRAVQNSYVGTGAGRSQPSNPMQWLGKLRYDVIIKRSFKFVGENREVLLEGWTVPFLELPAWESQHAELAQRVEEDLFFGNYSKQHSIAAGIKAMYRGSLLAIMLERYRLALGAYPESLEALTPQFTDELPQDPFSGKDFVYQRIEDDYLLYSVYRDQQDNGGRRNQQGKDYLIHTPPKWGEEEPEEEPRGPMRRLRGPEALRALRGQ